MISGEESLVFDTGYLHSWGTRITGINSAEWYDNGHGSRVRYPTSLIASQLSDVDMFQLGSSLAVNPYTWGFDGPDELVNSQMVRVGLALTNGSFIDLDAFDTTADKVHHRIT